MQETAVALWKRFDQYDPSFPFVPWGCRFALRHVMKHREQKARSGRCLSLSVDLIERLGARRIEEDDLLEDRRRALSICLKQLNAAERLLVENRYERETTMAQMAALTGQDVSYLYRALDRVRRRLQECINRRLKLGGIP